jgi:hypothetical protein
MLEHNRNLRATPGVFGFSIFIVIPGLAQPEPGTHEHEQHQLVEASVHGFPLSRE